ncbi:acyloxyacyl hydrolase [Shewanella sp. A25]|nr:acyloxyacyl hydrolase [Shewanella shenzhenensis]
MDNKTIKCFVTLERLSVTVLLASGSFGVMALENTGIGISDGQPTTKQNVEINSWDLDVRHLLWEPDNDLASVGAIARVGQLSMGKETGFRTGLGIFLAKDFDWVSFSIPFGIVWLDKSEFGAGELHTKDYGGNWQFTYAGEMAVKVSKNWHFFYRFEHMSNWNNYEHNPALKSHNLGIRFNF